MRAKGIYFQWLLIVSISVLPVTLTAQNPAGMVMECKGKNQVIRGKKTINLKRGMSLWEYDSVVVAQNGAVIILDSLDGLTMMSVSGRFRVSESQKKSYPSAKRFFNEWVSARQWFEKNRGKKKSPKRSGETLLRLISPRNSKLLSAPSALVWENREKNTGVELIIRCYEKDFVFQEAVSGVSFAPSVEWDVGVQYYWTVQFRGSGPASAAPEVWFSIMTPQELKKYQEDYQILLSILKNDTTSVAAQLLMANLSFQYGLLEDSRKHLDAVLAVEPDNSVAHLFYARLTERMDLLEETVRYMELTEKYEK